MKNTGGGGGRQINFRLAFVNLLVCGLYPFDIAYSACHVPMLKEGPLGTRSHQPAGDIQVPGKFRVLHAKFGLGLVLHLWGDLDDFIYPYRAGSSPESTYVLLGSQPPGAGALCAG